MSKLTFVLLIAVASGAPVVDKRLASLQAKTRSKLMEKKALLQDTDHKTESSDATTKLGMQDAYNLLKQKCIDCKLAEDAVVSQLELVVSLHDYADEKLNEYDSAKAAAEEASTKATSLETARDSACEGAPESDTPTPTTPTPTTPTPTTGGCSIN